MCNFSTAADNPLILTRQDAASMTGTSLCLSEPCRLIASEAFRGHPRLETILLPPSLTDIGARAFQSCTFLKELSLPHSVRRLGPGCFSLCPHLRTVRISNRVTEIPSDAFREDRRLERVLFTKGSRLTLIRKDAFSECTSLKFLLLPSGVTSIEARAFHRCKELRAVRFPEGLKSIGQKAFYFCGLESLELPSSLEVLEDSAFFKCTQLTEVCLPTGIRHIGKWVFHGCSRLKVLEIRHDPEYIGEWIINRAAKIRCYRNSKADAYCQASGFTVEYIE